MGLDEAVENIFSAVAPTNLEIPAGPEVRALLLERCAQDAANRPSQRAKSNVVYGETHLKSAWASCTRRACQAWLCIFESLNLDAKLGHVPTEEPAAEMVHFLSCLDLADLMLKWVKESSCYVAAKMLQQEENNLVALTELCAKIDALKFVGKRPTTGSLGFGWVKRRVRFLVMKRDLSRGHLFREKLLTAANSIQMIKRGMPCMRPALVARAYADHKAALSTVHVCPDEGVRDQVEIALRHLTTEIFANTRIHAEEVLPSLNAGYGAVRRNGGALGRLISEFDQAILGSDRCSAKEREALKSQIDDCLLMSCLGESVLVRMDELAPGVKGVPTFVVEVREEAGLRDLIALFTTFVNDRAEDIALGTTEANAAPGHVCEPCKVRMITAEDVYACQRALNLQKFLHGKLRQIDVFQWIGKPIDSEEWAATFALPLPVGTSIVSGDYKAATDNLDPQLSEAALFALADCGCLGDEYETAFWLGLGLKTLTRHILDYSRPEGFEELGMSTVPQRWGQLMGSPVSFPILNLVNAAATAVGLGWRLQTGGSVLGFLRRHHVRTNGDDVVFLCPDGKYEPWKQTLAACGLCISLGKNFKSREFAIMNSEMRHVAPAEGPLGSEGLEVQTWRFVPFLNLPLLLGLEAKGMDAGHSTNARTAWFELGPVSRALVRECDAEVAANRVEAFLAYYAEVLGRVPPGVHYFTPERLGGVGIPDPYATQVAPEGNRLRSAWLACLSQERLAQALVPPGRVQPGLLGALLARYSSEQVRAYRIIEQDVQFTTRLRDTGGCVGIQSLGRLLRSYLSDSDLKDAVCCNPDSNFANATKRAGFWRFANRSDKVQTRGYVWEAALGFDERERARREAVVAHRIMRQCTLARKSGLTPMDMVNVREWFAPFQVIEVTRDLRFHVDVFPEPECLLNLDMCQFEENAVDDLALEGACSPEA